MYLPFHGRITYHWQPYLEFTYVVISENEEVKLSMFKCQRLILENAPVDLGLERMTSIEGVGYRKKWKASIIYSVTDPH